LVPEYFHSLVDEASQVHNSDSEHKGTGWKLCAINIGARVLFTVGAVGAVSNEAAASNSVVYTYDAVGRVKSITDAAGVTISYTYDLNGNVTQRSLSVSGQGGTPPSPPPPPPPSPPPPPPPPPPPSVTVFIPTKSGIIIVPPAK
jgi:YD repeat-containing protein